MLVPSLTFMSLTILVWRKTKLLTFLYLTIVTFGRGRSRASPSISLSLFFSCFVFYSVLLKQIIMDWEIFTRTRNSRPKCLTSLFFCPSCRCPNVAIHVCLMSVYGVVLLLYMSLFTCVSSLEGETGSNMNSAGNRGLKINRKTKNKRGGKKLGSVNLKILCFCSVFSVWKKKICLEVTFPVRDMDSRHSGHMYSHLRFITRSLIKRQLATSKVLSSRARPLSAQSLAACTWLVASWRLQKTNKIEEAQSTLKPHPSNAKT